MADWRDVDGVSPRVDGKVQSLQILFHQVKQSRPSDASELKGEELIENVVLIAMRLCTTDFVFMDQYIVAIFIHCVVIVSYECHLYWQIHVTGQLIPLNSGNELASRTSSSLHQSSRKVSRGRHLILSEP